MFFVLNARGIDCLNNRHYDPTTGVFTSVDPLVTETTQPYIYGAANPVRYSDPDGLDPDTRGDVRAEAERRGGCTYSSTIEACQGKGPRRGPTKWSTPTPAGPYLPTAVASEDYDPDPVAQRLATLGVHPHRPVSWSNGQRYVGGYADATAPQQGPPAPLGGAELRDVEVGVSEFNKDPVGVGKEIYDRVLGNPQSRTNSFLCATGAAQARFGGFTKCQGFVTHTGYSDVSIA